MAAYAIIAELDRDWADLCRKAVEAQGVRAVIVRDGNAATKLRQTRGAPVLLITDYAMGKMNGLDLIERCKALDPTLRTILVSGTAGAEIIMNSPVHVDRFMAKPYQPSGLSDLVKRVLDL